MPTLKPSLLKRAMRATGYVWSGIFCAAAFLSISACAAGPNTTTADLGKQASLSLGQRVSINGEPLEIRFDSVISDSRCPTGVTCIWRGEASCRLEILYKGTSNTLIVTEPGLSGEPATTDFSEYQFQHDLSPYPEAGKQIDKGSYKLVLTVNRSSSEQQK